MTLLETVGLTKRYGGVMALGGIDLALDQGEVHGLVGENGAGKSTLIRCWAGAERPDGGELRLDGARLALASPRDAEQAGFRFIHQELNLVPAFSVVENVYVGRRYPRRGGLIDWPAMRRTVGALAETLAPALPLDVPVGRLSIGQRQMAEIIRAFLTEARLVVMDEPTAALGDAEAERLFAAIRRLRSRGVAVVYVSHRLDEVLALADQVTVLRDGHVVATRPAAGLAAPDLVRAMSGGKAAERRRTATPPGVADDVVLRFAADPARSGMPGLEVRRGEIVGLYGLIGAGRSRLLRRLFGAAPATGQWVGPAILLDGVPFQAPHPAAAIARGIAYVPEDRRLQGLVLRHGIRANVTLPLLRRFRRRRWLPLPSRRSERAYAARVCADLAVRHVGLEQPVGRLSGGNQQKLLLGRWLAQDTRLYLLDEPTRGIDVGAKAEIHDRIRQLAADGAAVLFASSDLQEVVALADRIIVLRDGAPVACLAGAAATPLAVLEACYGG